MLPDNIEGGIAQHYILQLRRAQIQPWNAQRHACYGMNFNGRYLHVGIHAKAQRLGNVHRTAVIYVAPLVNISIFGT